MAYSHNLIRKGIKRKDARMAAKGAADAAVTSSLGFVSINQAIYSLQVQG